MPLYQAYGLRIDSAIELPELSSALGGFPADITFRKASVEPADQPESNIGLTYPGIVSLLLKRGTDVDVDANPEIDPRILRLILLGPVLGLILHQRGFLVLHASAVEINDIAVAFIGDKGAGKSTTAAAFNARGHALLADDVVAVAPTSHLVYPGFPQLKLWRETAEHMTPGSKTFESLHPDLDKVALHVRERFGQNPRTLKRVYALSDGENLEIQSLPPQQTFMELIRNSYTLSLLQSTGSSESHFRQAVDLASHAPVRRLVRPRSLPSLPKLVSAVVNDAA